jgi:ribosomal protein S18 acetylase RimI-like enzyme
MVAPIIRDATRFDHRAIRALAPRLAEGAAPWRPAEGFAAAAAGWLDESLAGQDDDHPVWVAEIDGLVVGVAAAVSREHFSGPRECYLGELAVDDRLEGAGIGRALVAHAELWARARGLTALTLETGAANARARGFYASLGFAEEQVQLTKPLAP